MYQISASFHFNSKFNSIFDSYPKRTFSQLKVEITALQIDHHKAFCSSKKLELNIFFSWIYSLSEWIYSDFCCLFVVGSHHHKNTSITYMNMSNIKLSSTKCINISC